VEARQHPRVQMAANQRCRKYGGHCPPCSSSAALDDLLHRERGGDYTSEEAKSKSGDTTLAPPDRKSREGRADTTHGHKDVVPPLP
jgi:hypothetical protein